LATNGADNENDQLCLVKHNLFSETRNNRNFLARSLDNIHLGKRGEINTDPKNHAKNLSKSNK